MRRVSRERKTYMEEVYSTYWLTAREKIYGFLEYDKHLCNYLCKLVPKRARLLDVGIGTSYPFADFFQKSGYSVYGIDISPDLIKKCQKLYPNIDCKLGDAENLEYPDNYFDVTYSFHSTFYFPNLNKAIDEMIRVTRPSCFVIFDIQNRNNQDINNGYQKRIAEYTGALLKIKISIINVAKMVLRRGSPNWHFVVHEVPTYPESIYEHLKERQISNFRVMVKKEDESIETRNELGSFEQFPRLVFVVRKQENAKK